MKPNRCTPIVGCDDTKPTEQIEYVYSANIYRNGKLVFEISNLKARPLEEGLEIACGKPGIKLRR